MRNIALFNGFFRNFIDSSDDVETEADNITEQVRSQVEVAVDAVTPIDDNAEVRQQFLEDMESQAEDPMDAFLRRSRERRHAENMMLRREEEARLSDELNSFNPLIPGLTNAPHSSDQIENLVERTRPAFHGYPHYREDNHRQQAGSIIRARQSMTPGEFRRFIGLSESYSSNAEATPSGVINNMAAGFQAVSNSLNSQHGIARVPELFSIEKAPIISNEDHMKLESQLQDFALLVQQLLHAESPADFSIQKALVEESLLTILPKQEKSSEIPDESSTRRKLDLELD